MDNDVRPAYDVESDDSDRASGELETYELYKRLCQWFTSDMNHSSDWRKRAKENFGFIAGDQWSKADKAYLDDNKRLPIVFNRCLSILKAVAGQEINARSETIYMPRGTAPGEVRANEILTAASQWMADGCDAEDEQSAAFQNSLICGMGWTEARIDYDMEPDGQYVEESLDPLEMYWDKNARKKNLVDARRMFRVRKMTLGEAKQLFPDAAEEDLDAPFARGVDELTDPKPIEQRRKKLDGVDETPLDSDEVHIVHAQWYERVPYWRVTDPTTGEIVELDDDTHEMMETEAKAKGIQVTQIKQYKRVYKQAFVGGTILGDVMDAPVPDRFSWSCITGELDRNKGTFYHLVDTMKDPQRLANKLLSTVSYMLSTSANGGIIAEAGAFKDQRQAEDTYAAHDMITWAAKDAVSGGKIMQKPGAVQNFGTFTNLLQYGVTSIRDVTGINLELMGMRDANQPGILEAQRKQAAMTILATAFDSLRRFRKNVGRIRLYYIQQYIADGRLIRVAGKDGQELVPLLREHTLGDYEVIVEDAPTSPNSKEQTWHTIQQVIPAFKELLTPQAVITILEYSPLPSKLVSAFKEMADAPNPDAEKEKEIAMAMAQIKMRREGAAAMKDEAQAEKTRLDGMIDLATAGVQAAQLGLLPATQQIMSPEPWGHMPIQDITPMPSQGGVMMPTTPPMPGVPMGQEPPPLPMGPPDEDFLPQ